MDIAFLWIEVDGRRVVIEGKHRQEGQGNTAATVGTALAAGPFAVFVTGKSASVPNGMHLKAFTAEAIQFRPDGLQPVAQQASIVSNGPAVSQGTTPSVAPVASSDHAQ